MLEFCTGIVNNGSAGLPYNSRVSPVKDSISLHTFRSFACAEIGSAEDQRFSRPQVTYKHNEATETRTICFWMT